jgi:hypothetical protein
MSRSAAALSPGESATRRDMLGAHGMRLHRRWETRYPPTGWAAAGRCIAGARAIRPAQGRATTDHTRRDVRAGQEGPSCG